MDAEAKVTLMLLSCVVHLAEHIDTGEPLDLAAATGNLNDPDVLAYLATVDRALLPCRRDNKPPLDFAGLGYGLRL